MSTPTFYTVLGVSTTCTADDIRRAYHQAARKHHPDKCLNDSNAIISPNNVDIQCFLRVQEAYETLRDSVLRQQYDIKLRNDSVRTMKCMAVVVSDEVSVRGMRRAVLESEDGVGNEIIYTHQCRCGEFYEITLDELQDGLDVVACTGCSLHIRVV